MGPLVSIIVPSYNHEKFVVATLDSVISDSYPNKELVIIDDGSTDNSVSVIKNWIQHNQESIEITFISRQNQGVCTTLNELIKTAKGKYILPLASDDFLINNTIGQRIEILQEHPEKYVLFSDAIVIDGNGKVVMESSISEFHSGNKESYKDDMNIIKATMVNPSFSGPILLINRNIYSEIGLYREDLLVEDWYFWQRAACKRRVLFYDKVVACYRRHETNISGANSNYNLNVRYDIFKTFVFNFFLFPGIEFKIIAINQILIRGFLIIAGNIRRWFRKILQIKNKS